MISKLVASRVETFDGGKLWARRVRTQVVPNDADIFEQFFYASLNPIAAGLVEKHSEYPGYNSFSDAIRGRARNFKVIEWTDYNNRKRKNPSLTTADCTKIHKLVYARLPGHENKTQKEYVDFMNAELERRRSEKVTQRKESGLGFATARVLQALTPGAKPRSTKTAQRHTHRPLVLTLCRETRKQFKEWYFDLLGRFKAASAKFREGLLDVDFPSGTYRPWSCCSFCRT